MSIATSPVVAPKKSSSTVAPVLIANAWQSSHHAETFSAFNPRTRQPIGDEFPVSTWPDIDAALAAAAKAAVELRALPDAAARIAAFLDAFAAGIEAQADELAAIATDETGLPVKPRLRDVELPRTINQLRQAAVTVRDASWQRPTIDTKLNLRSHLAPLGPVWVIGPNNFPFAFNAMAGGDFASAIAAGNPVIAKAHPVHPASARALAEIALAAASELPVGTVQMLYHMSPADGLKLIADPRLKAVGFTGSRHGGLALKAAADAAGKPFFGELSSVNPVVVLPGALTETGPAIADQFVTSMLMSTGQFCTKPGIVVLPAGDPAEAFIDAVRAKMTTTPAGLLFSEAGVKSITSAIDTLKSAGADQLLGDTTATESAGFCVPNTLLRVTGEAFLKDAATFQTEAFGNAALIVTTADLAETVAVLESFEGNLTGTIYSSATNVDDIAYAAVAAALRPRVGRLINDKMPTGVAVSPAMNHGGPFPASTQPHFTSVGFPAAALRFTQLESYDNVRPNRLPAVLQNKNATGKMWRLIDGQWTRADLADI